RTTSLLDSSSRVVQRKQQFASTLTMEYTIQISTTHTRPGKRCGNAWKILEISNRFGRKGPPRLGTLWFPSTIVMRWSVYAICSDRGLTGKFRARASHDWNKF